VIVTALPPPANTSHRPFRPPNEVRKKRVKPNRPARHARLGIAASHASIGHKYPAVSSLPPIWVTTPFTSCSKNFRKIYAHFDLHTRTPRARCRPNWNDQLKIVYLWSEPQFFKFFGNYAWLFVAIDSCSSTTNRNSTLRLTPRRNWRISPWNREVTRAPDIRTAVCISYVRNQTDRWHPWNENKKDFLACTAIPIKKAINHQLKFAMPTESCSPLSWISCCNWSQKRDEQSVERLITLRWHR